MRLANASYNANIAVLEELLPLATSADLDFVARGDWLDDDDRGMNILSVCIEGIENETQNNATSDDQHIRLQAVRLLLNYFDVNDSKDGKRNLSTPLHHAASYGYSACIALLLSYNANIEARDGYGHTPLVDAVMINCRDSVEILLAHGANSAVIVPNLGSTVAQVIAKWPSLQANRDF